MKIRHLIVPAFALFAAAASAQQYVDYAAHTELGTDAYDEQWQGATAGDPLVHTSDQPGFGFASTFASGEYGVNRAAVQLQGTNSSNPVTKGVAYAGSSYFDAFLIDNPNLNGTSGWFTTTLFVHGVGSASIDEGFLNGENVSFEASWNAAITVQSDGVGITQEAFYGGGWLKPFDFSSFEYSGDQLNTYQTEVEFAFVYGEPIFLETRLATFAQVQNENGEAISFDANLDLGHSAYWGGIRNVTDANRNAVSSYGYGSLSGFDYRLNFKPVPEPASMLALAGGVALLLKRRRKPV